MNDNSITLEELIVQESERIKRKVPLVQKIEFACKQDGRGLFLAKVIARTPKKTIILTKENRCPKKSTRQVFSNLMRALAKNKFKKLYRENLHFAEAF